MFRPFIAFSILCVFVLAPVVEAAAHCQVPCGIYDETARIGALHEDATTIAKAATQIHQLSTKTDATSAQQLVRWTLTKEEHATRIIRVVAEYFLTQKLKPADPKDKKAHAKYIAALTSCHQLMRAAMVTKQKPEVAAHAALVKAIDAMAGHFVHSHK